LALRVDDVFLDECLAVCDWTGIILC
jgi:hypothetical protein